MPLEDWRRVLSVNLDSVWLLSQAAGKRMVTQGSGKIIIVSSVLASQGGLRVPAYASSKHAVVGLTRALCNEWAPHGVNVNCIAPGYTATDNTQALRDDPDRSKALLERIPAGRFADPSEIAGAAVFLASDAASLLPWQCGHRRWRLACTLREDIWNNHFKAKPRWSPPRATASAAPAPRRLPRAARQVIATDHRRCSGRRSGRRVRQHHGHALGRA